MLVLAARPEPAQADDAGPTSYRLVIDRVDLEPASIGGLRLRVELSALALQGQLLDLSDPKSIKLMFGKSQLDAPFARGHYGETGADTAIVFVVQINLVYADVLPSIQASLDDAVLAKLGDRSQVAILGYGDSTDAGKLGSLKSARGKLGQLSQDGSAGEPALLDTLDRAVRLLRKARPVRDGAPLRRLIVVIGDGRDRAGDHERVTQVGVRAGRDGIRIHTIGFAPSNVRRPLLVLGELSRQSLGTFRWVRTAGADSWTRTFQQLNDEINKQYVLTYFVPVDADVAGKKLHIATVGRTLATSNEMKVPDATCGRDPCAGYCVDEVCAIERESSSRGVLGWLVLVLGLGLGAIAVLGVIGYVLQRRRAPEIPGVIPLPGQAMPGQVPGPIPGQMPGQPSAGQAPAPPGKPAKPAKPPKSRPPKNQPVVGPPAGGPVLLVLTGPRAGQRIPLQNGFTIGKAPTSSLVLDDGYTSTQHAQIVMDASGVCRLFDRQSTNGTFVNGVRVTDAVLDHGMSVRIGSTELRFLAQ
ncbi:MAG: FHA domain-containing protein [Deltaproteobacteria bacterium]|nr:MAG: FHA domain-containing protein [Deltaproteobacteria bacterium]